MDLLKLKVYFLFLLFGLIIVTNNLRSQDKNDFKVVSNLFETKKEKPDYMQFIKENPNELRLITSGLFLFYKSFFSSQDGNRCVFHPSCSVYTLESIKKNGLFIGIMDGMDRLLRCNRLSPENYERYQNTNLLYDPVN